MKWLKKMIPGRRLYWKEKARKAFSGSKGLGGYLRNRRSASESLSIEGKKTELNIGKREMVLKGTEHYRFLYQSTKYMQKKRKELDELRKKLPRILDALLQTNHPVWTIKRCFIECVVTGESKKEANPKGPDVEMQMEDKFKISVRYRLQNKLNWEKPMVIELKPLHIETAKKINSLENKLYNVSIKKIDEETFKEIQAIK